MRNHDGSEVDDKRMFADPGGLDGLGNPNSPTGRRWFSEQTEKELNSDVRDEIEAAGATVALNREIEKGFEVKTEIVTPAGMIRVPGRLSAAELKRIEAEWFRLHSSGVDAAESFRSMRRALEALHGLSPARYTTLEKWSLGALLVFAGLFILAAFL